MDAAESANEQSSTDNPTEPPGHSKLLSSTATYTVGAVLQRGLAFLLLPFLTRLLGVHEYGLVATGLALSTVLSLVFNLGINFSIERLYYDEAEDAPRAAWAGLVRVQILLALLMAALTWALGPWWSGLFKGIEWGPVLKSAVFFSLAQAVQSSSQAVLRAAQRAKAYVTVGVLQSIVGASLGLYLATRVGASGYLTGLGVGSIAAGAYALAINYRRPLWKLSYLRIGLFLSVPFVFHQLSGWILDLSDRVLIARYLGVEAVARYHVAYTIASIIVILLTSVNSAWAPHYYGTMTEVAKGRVPGSLVLPLNILCAAASLFLVTASPILLRLAAPKAFGSAVFVLAVVAGAASMRATYYLATVVLFDKKDSVSIAKSSGAAAIGNIVLNVLFLKHFGIIVSGVSTSLCMALMALFIMRKAEKKSSLHFPTARLIGIWVSSTAVLVAVAAIPMAGSTWLLRLGLGMFALIVMWLAGIRARDNYRAAIA